MGFYILLHFCFGVTVFCEGHQFFCFVMGVTFDQERVQVCSTVFVLLNAVLIFGQLFFYYFLKFLMFSILPFFKYFLFSSFNSVAIEFQFFTCFIAIASSWSGGLVQELLVCLSLEFKQYFCRRFVPWDFCDRTCFRLCRIIKYKMVNIFI